MRNFASLLLSLVAIAFAGTGGVLAALAVVHALELSGVFAAFVAVILGIVVATLIWIAGVALFRGLRWLK